MTLPEFANIFGILALQLQCRDADEVMIRAYYAVLKDVDLELVQMAATQFAEQPGDHGSWFPKTADWTAAARKIAADRMAVIQETVRKRRLVQQPLCVACEDTGWVRDAQDRMTHCDCRAQRRLEAIGRRPLPALPPALEPPADAVTVEQIHALVQQLSGRRRMPRVRVPRTAAGVPREAE